MRRFFYWVVRLTLKPFLSPRVPVSVQRFWGGVAALTVKAAPGCSNEPFALGSVPGRKLVPATAQAGRALLYLHGGAYVIGGPASHAKLAGRLAHAVRATAYFVDYRLAPEHPFPAALDDALAAYRWLLQTHAAGAVTLAGDSAGAGLALALAMTLRDQGLPAPARLVLLSPFTDLTLSGASHRDKAGADPMLTRAWLAACGAMYAGSRPLTDPLVSPLLGDLSRLPPMLVQVGSEEILLSDAEELARRARAAGTAVTLQRYDGLWHDFQVHAGSLADADRALERIGEFADAAHG